MTKISEYKLIQNAFYKHYKHDPAGKPGNYFYQFLKFERNGTSGVWGASYRSLYEKQDWWRPLHEWFEPLSDQSTRRYVLITNDQEIDLCRQSLWDLYERYYHTSDIIRSEWKEITVSAIEKNLSDLTEVEARKICELLDLEFQSFLPRDATDYLPEKQKIKILGEGRFSTTVEIHESGQIAVFYGAKQVLISEINTLPITDYLRSCGYVFKY